MIMVMGVLHVGVVVRTRLDAAVAIRMRMMISSCCFIVAVRMRARRAHVNISLLCRIIVMSMRVLVTMRLGMCMPLGVTMGMTMGMTVRVTYLLVLRLPHKKQSRSNLRGGDVRP